MARLTWFTSGITMPYQDLFTCVTIAALVNDGSTVQMYCSYLQGGIEKELLPKMTVEEWEKGLFHPAHLLMQIRLYLQDLKPIEIPLPVEMV